MKKQDGPLKTYSLPRSEDGRGNPDSAGQSGDTQGLSGISESDSESVRQLVEEGQSLEAEALEGVENADDPDVSEVVTRQIPEDDVPAEYTDPD